MPSFFVEWQQAVPHLSPTEVLNTVAATFQILESLSLIVKLLILKAIAWLFPPLRRMMKGLYKLITILIRPPLR